jgi:DNA-binding NarL/FixJ family response regulator
MENGVSFLIAEDDAMVGRVLVRALSEHGRTDLVTTVAGARAALSRCAYSAVVVDVGLPDGSGLELITAARRQYPGMSALIVSGGVDERRLAEAHDLGASYLLKPVDTKQLDLFAQRMRTRLRSHRAKLSSVIERWAADYRLTAAEAAVLELSVNGAPRARLAELRGVAPSTVKKQVQVILTKTGDISLDGVANRILRTILDET